MEGLQAVDGSGYLLPEPAGARKAVPGSALSYFKVCGQWQSVQRSQNLPEPAECRSIAWRPCTRAYCVVKIVMPGAHMDTDLSLMTLSA